MLDIFQIVDYFILTPRFVEASSASRVSRRFHFSSSSIPGFRIIPRCNRAGAGPPVPEGRKATREQGLCLCSCTLLRVPVSAYGLDASGATERRRPGRVKLLRARAQNGKRDRLVESRGVSRFESWRARKRGISFRFSCSALDVKEKAGGRAPTKRGAPCDRAQQVTG